MEANQSLCWNCKHGICVKESVIEHLVHLGIEGLPPHMMNNEEENPFSVDFDNNQEPEEGQLEHTVERQIVKTYCFWRPSTVSQSPPLMMYLVHQCNAFEPKGK